MADPVPSSTPASPAPAGGTTTPTTPTAPTTGVPTPAAAPSTTTPAAGSKAGTTPEPSDSDALKKALQNEATEKEALEKKKEGDEPKKPPFKMDGGETFKMAMAAYEARLLCNKKAAELAKQKAGSVADPQNAKPPKDSPAPGSTTVTVGSAATPEPAPGATTVTVSPAPTPEQKIYNTAARLLAILEKSGTDPGKANEMWKEWAAAHPADSTGKTFYHCLEKAIADVQNLPGGPRYQSPDPTSGIPQDALSKIKDWAGLKVKDAVNLETIAASATEASDAKSAKTVLATAAEPTAPRGPGGTT